MGSRLHHSWSIPRISKALSKTTEAETERDNGEPARPLKHENSQASGDQSGRESLGFS
jgi:hypothetical protein